MNTKFDKLFNKIISENKQYKKVIKEDNVEMLEQDNTLLQNDEFNYDNFNTFYEAVCKNTNIMNYLYSSLQNYNDTDIKDIVTQVWLNYGYQYEDQVFETFGREKFDIATEEEKIEMFLEILNRTQSIDIFKETLQNFNFNQAEEQFPNPNPEDNIQEIPQDFREEQV